MERDSVFTAQVGLTLVAPKSLSEVFASVLNVGRKDDLCHLGKHISTRAGTLHLRGSLWSGLRY